MLVPTSGTSFFQERLCQNICSARQEDVDLSSLIFLAPHTVPHTSLFALNIYELNERLLEGRPSAEGTMGSLLRPQSNRFEHPCYNAA